MTPPPPPIPLLPPAHHPAMRALRSALPCVLALSLPCAALAQAPRPLMPIDFTRSAEWGWLQKEVHARRTVDDMTDPARWTFSGTATLGRAAAGPAGRAALRIDMRMFTTERAPTRSGMSSAYLRLPIAGEDWRGYNRLSLWVRPDYAGIAALPLQIVLHSQGAERVPDVYGREGTHYVTLEGNGWQRIVWEIEPLARDRVTAIEIGYWVNRMLAEPEHRVAFELGPLELERVDPDHHTGWSAAPGALAYSHSGYQPGRAKTALATGLAAGDFSVLRVDDQAFGALALHAPVRTVRTRLGEFQELDFSAVRDPGTYVLEAGGVRSEPFRIGADAWEPSIWKALNFLYGNRCGHPVPGVHGVDHLDWLAAHGDRRITMSGGWHDAGDLSQGIINTGETTYALFALAERLQERGADPALVARVLEEARWGLDWVLRVRFPGGHRIGFGSHNYWSNNVVGDADDRIVEAKNNPNANYIAAAAAGIAARVLRDTDPELARRALEVARDDWAHALVGVEGPSTWHTPAFAASRMELAGIGVTASLELFRATGERAFADTAASLARVIMASQQVEPVGRDFPLSGFFYTGPDRDTLFHQFHRAADQAPIVALAQLVEALPEHRDRERWRATIARHLAYQKRTATTTEPWGVLPAYVYRVGDERVVADSGDRYGGTKAAYREQVLQGMAMGDGWYLRAFPVWFSRRGNYGVLLSQAKALSTAGRLLGDSAAMELAERQAQWVVGRNPFAQSTMYGEGHRWAQQYSVSSGDLVGALPVGMQSRGVTDLPYWPSQNMYVYKEVWIHPVARWLWLVADLME